MEPIIHAIIPVLFLLAIFPNLEKKYVFLLFPLTWIIDLDSYFGLHRFILHNIFFILSVAIILYFSWNMKASLVAVYYGLSHLILDFAFPGVALFYPIVPKTYYVISSIQLFPFDIDFSIGSMTLNEYTVFLSTFEYSQYFGETSLIILTLATILILFKYRYTLLQIFKK